MIPNWKLNALRLALGAAFALAFAQAQAVPTTPDGSDSADTSKNATVIANRILDRWQGVAQSAGAASPAWREMFMLQMQNMSVSTLQGLDSLQVSKDESAKTAYGEFAMRFKGALAQTYSAKLSGKVAEKLGSATSDFIYIPIVPCRLIDTRNVAGPIAAGVTRNYYFYTDVGSFDWGANYGGTPGAASTVCPGTYFPDDAPQHGAAVITVSVVTPSAAGNWIVWGGGSPVPTVSALNWNGAGAIAVNTTVVPAGGRSTTLDWAVKYNGPSGDAQLTADVVGYFVENTATALDCLQTTPVVSNVANNATINFNPAACPAGYTRVSLACHATSSFSGTQWSTSGINTTGSAQCQGFNASGAAQDYNAVSTCCRLPGR